MATTNNSGSPTSEFHGSSFELSASVNVRPAFATNRSGIVAFLFVKENLNQVLRFQAKDQKDGEQRAIAVPKFC